MLVAPDLIRGGAAFPIALKKETALARIMSGPTLRAVEQDSRGDFSMRD
jgi:hypothetical protein